MIQPSALLIHTRDEFGWSDVRAALDQLRVPVVGEAAGPDAAIALATQRRADLVLASSNLAGDSSLPMLAEIRRIHLPDSRLIVFAHELDQYDLMAFAQLKLSGFLTWRETRSTETIACTIRLAIAGEAVVGSWSIARDYSTVQRGVSGVDQFDLSDFERRIMIHRAQGRKYAGIATLEGVSQRRVERAFEVLYDKLDASDPFTLGMKAALLGFVP